MIWQSVRKWIRRGMWTVVALVAVATLGLWLPVFLAIIYTFGLGKRAPGACKCGYDLRGLPGPRCPECGAAFLPRFDVSSDAGATAGDIQRARAVLAAGGRVQLVHRFRGREMMRKEVGLERLARAADELSAVAGGEGPPQWVDREAVLTLAPLTQDGQRKGPAGRGSGSSAGRP